MTAVREPAVAGLFYPGTESEAREQLKLLLDWGEQHATERAAGAGAPGRGRLRAVIAPHAGWVYSGPTASHAYARVAAEAERFARVILLGPTHRVYVRGSALPGADALRTPLGDVPVDTELAARAARLPGVVVSAEVHREEHSLEVHLPFLQTVLPGRPVLPLAVGDVPGEQVADVLETLLTEPTEAVNDRNAPTESATEKQGDSSQSRSENQNAPGQEAAPGHSALAEDTLVVVSTDLSHYLPQEKAVSVDQATLRQVLGLDPAIAHEQACGATPMIGLMILAQRHGWTPHLLDRTTSADTAGDPHRVVGYAALQFTTPVDDTDGASNGRTGRVAEAGPNASTSGNTIGQPTEQPIDPQERERLFALLPNLARASIERHVGRRGAEPSWGPLPDLEHPALVREGASFVTLTRTDGSLRGCIGSLTAYRPLGEDVAAHAVDAAVHDPRFRPVTAEELPELHVEVSVLSDPEPLTTGAESTEAEALAMLRPGVDGVILSSGANRATFLPQVWEQLPEPAVFMDHLRRKAGLPENYWGPGVLLQRYTATEYHEGAPGSTGEGDGS